MNLFRHKGNQPTGQGREKEMFRHINSLRLARPLFFLGAAALIAWSLILFASGCGGGGTEATAGATGTTAPISPTTLTATTSTSAGVTVPPAPSPAPSPAPAPAAAAALRIVDYSVNPNSVHASAPLTCTVTVEGEATSVRMGLTGPSGSTSQTVNLTRGSTSGGITTWSSVTTAPVTVGGWRFGATAVAADGTEVIPDAGGLSASLLPFEVIP